MTYANCPIADNGCHRISYNKFRSKAYCVLCGFILITIDSPFATTDFEFKYSFREQNLRNRSRLN